MNQLNSSTVSDPQAAMLKAKAAAKARKLSILVPLQKKGKKTPFFCIHPIAGVVFPYQELASLLDNERPFYGLQYPMLSEQGFIKTIPEMASFYIQEIKKVQPNSPYILGGWSFGATVALEMAQQLKKAGEEDISLIILDQGISSSNKIQKFFYLNQFFLTSGLKNIWPYVIEYLKINLGNPANHNSVRNSNSSSISEISAIKKREQTKLKLKILGLIKVFPILFFNSLAFMNYEIQSYQGQVILFKSENSFKNGSKTKNLGWEHIATQGIDCHSISGHHLNLLRKPYVEKLAQQLKTVLDSLKYS